LAIATKLFFGTIFGREVVSLSRQQATCRNCLFLLAATQETTSKT
jgi:hypothetical protein